MLSLPALGIRAVLRRQCRNMLKTEKNRNAGARSLLNFLTRQRQDTLADTGDYSEPLPISHDTVRLRTTLSALEDAKREEANEGSEVPDPIAFGSSSPASNPLNGNNTTCRNDQSVEGTVASASESPESAGEVNSTENWQSHSLVRRALHSYIAQYLYGNKDD